MSSKHRPTLTHHAHDPNSAKMITSNTIKPFKISGAGEIRIPRRIQGSVYDDERQDENEPPGGYPKRKQRQVSASALDNATSSSLNAGTTTKPLASPKKQEKASKQPTGAARTPSRIPTATTPRNKKPPGRVEATTATKITAKAPETLEHQEGAATTPPKPAPTRTISKLGSPKSRLPQFHLPQVLEVCSPSRCPSTPTLKGRKLQEWNHEHARKGYTPKMRDPRPPTVDWKDQKSPTASKNADFDWDVATEHLRARTPDPKPAEPTNHRSPKLMTPEKKKPLAPVFSPMEIPALPKSFPITALELIDLKDALAEIARGNVFCITIGDFHQLPNLIDMPRICRRVLAEYDFTDASSFSFPEGSEGSLMCKVVKKFLWNTKDDEFKAIMAGMVLKGCARMDGKQLVDYLNDEIELQRSHIKDLDDKRAVAEAAANRCMRDLVLAHEQLMKLVDLHGNAYALQFEVSKGGLPGSAPKAAPTTTGNNTEKFSYGSLELR